MKFDDILQALHHDNVVMARKMEIEATINELCAQLWELRWEHKQLSNEPSAVEVFCQNNKVENND